MPITSSPTTILRMQSSPIRKRWALLVSIPQSRTAADSTMCKICARTGMTPDTALLATAASTCTIGLTTRQAGSCKKISSRPRNSDGEESTIPNLPRNRTGKGCWRQYRSTSLSNLAAFAVKAWRTLWRCNAATFFALLALWSSPNVDSAVKD